MITYKPVTDYSKGIGKPNTGLGNQMFQVASTIGIATKNGHNFALPQWESPFENILPQLHLKHKEQLEGDNWKAIKVPWGYHDIMVPGDGENYRLRGYMQSEKYFKHCESLIRELFIFKEGVDNYSDFIAVHVRRGDYVDKSAHHTLLGRDYYERALAMLPDIPITVFTDMQTIAWQGDKSNLCDIVPGWNMVSNSNNDMAIMAQAKYHVIANSSFSWWGAWLSNSEKVIAPRNWFGPKKKHWSTKDLYPESWTVI